MAIKLKKNSEQLSNQRFSLAPKGYDSLEVDSLLDLVIKDYEYIEDNVLLTKGEYESLNKEIDALRKENTTLKVNLDKEKNKWKYVKNDGKDIHIDNLVLLRRIGKLEKIIYEKLHINPDDITFDPDDC